MKDEFSDRHQAIRLRLAGQPVDHICQALGRSRVWFHNWWRRYQALGVTGLFDLARATHQPPRLAPDLERTILNIRRRLESQVHPQTRCSLIGAGAILGECWKSPGRPQQIQFDNAREFLGWGPAARYLSRVIRLCLRFGVEPIFIPPASPQHNGAVEWFNGWFQPRLLQRHSTRVSALKRELQRLRETVNTQHVRRRLGGLTPTQHRRRQKLQRLPARFEVPLIALPIAAGRLTFISELSEMHCGISKSTYFLYPFVLVPSQPALFDCPFSQYRYAFPFDVAFAKFIE